MSLPIKITLLYIFLSTPSARRATVEFFNDFPNGTNFYPRPPRGGRPAQTPHPCGELAISIHALREEGDIMASTTYAQQWLFLSTPSARRATAPFGGLMEVLDISIHALREEGDSSP